MLIFTLISNEAKFYAAKLIKEAQDLQSINPNFRVYVDDMDVIEEILKQTKEQGIEIKFIRNDENRRVEYTREEMEIALNHNMEVRPVE